MKALQRFLVNSFSARTLAVKRVSESDGKRTPCLDGETWTTPEAKWHAGNNEKLVRLGRGKRGVE